MVIKVIYEILKQGGIATTVWAKYMMSNSAPETMVRIGVETFPALYDFLVVMTFLQVFF